MRITTPVENPEAMATFANEPLSLTGIAFNPTHESPKPSPRVPMNIPVTVSIPDIWGAVEFTKTEWGSINFLVGPNGTGKTRFAAKLKDQLRNSAFKPRYLSAERLAGLEKQNVMGHGSAFSQGFNVGEYAHYEPDPKIRPFGS